MVYLLRVKSKIRFYVVINFLKTFRKTTHPELVSGQN